ncbi:MAG: ACP S-malonyltransferase [Deltaproteobacteria bacterium]|nr:ACP S-malonyltransferase [Deltaproteobacteria bacterium]
MRRIILVCPGRGSYGRDTLRSIPRGPVVEAADAFRAALARPTPTEMDATDTFSSRLHVAGENASILTMTAALADLEQLREVEVVGVVGNSMGWYTALAAAGALSLQDALRLVETMGQYQANNVIGAQLLYPLVDDEWQRLPSPELELILDDTAEMYHSIHLGGQAVLGGSTEAINGAMKRLPPRKIGDRDAPMILPLHSAFHTPLMAPTAARAQHDLADLGWQSPAVPLVDGHGTVHWPRHGSPAALRAYTLGAQVTEPYDFGLGLVTALRELAPEAIVLLGPGGNLGGAAGQVLAREGWRGVHDKASFLALQAREPFVLAMSRPEQRALVT